MLKRLSTVIVVALSAMTIGIANAEVKIAKEPMFAVATVPPVVMLNMSVDSQLFFNAYPEFADLTGDGAAEQGYTHAFDYFGYFDSFKCYTYSTSSDRFVPVGNTTDKYCGGSEWSGNFLNWLTMARIDTVRKILYGGKRFIDDEGLTVLERTYLPNDAHSWVRFYDGNDINDLTPFSLGDISTTISPSEISVVPGSRRGAGDRFDLGTPGWTSSEVQLGDQIELTHASHPGVWMRGVVIGVTASDPSIRLQVTGSENPLGLTDSISGWTVTNRTRRGVSFCNTTVTSGASHGTTAISAPPLLMAARGNYSLWTANERWQCRWQEDVSPNVPDRMRIANNSFHNGNDVVSSGLWANSDSPRRSGVRLGDRDFNVRVEVCRDGYIGTENCQEYPEGTQKPIGLLQEFGDEGPLDFGLMTGSFTEHVDGGVLRKNITSFSDEVDQQTGQLLKPADSIVASLDALRIYGYSHNSGEYTAGDDNCVFGTSKNQMTGGRCFSWGNPQAEIFAESLRYFAGLDANPSFEVSGTDRLTGLTNAEWDNPITEARYCAPNNIIQFNASVTSYDDGAPSAVTGLPGIGSVDDWTNQVGTEEGIVGFETFFGGTDGFCEPDTLGNLAAFRGVCPEAPNQDGTYYIAGLAKYAAQADLRPTWPERQNVTTIGVSLAPAVPRISIPRPGESVPAVEILPACDNQGDGLRCQLADFRIVEQDIENGTGSFFVQWDVAEWGADFDMDVNGTLSYEITDTEITVETRTWADSSGRATGFGYIISGTNLDGFHAHSGINDYTRIVAGAPSCNNCRVAQPATSWTYQIGGGTAELLREPLYYAAKYGGGGVDENGEPVNYFFAIDPSELLNALRNAFQQVLDQVEAVTVTTSTSRLDAGAVIFEAGLSPEDWTGDVTAIDPLTDETLWVASEKTGWQDRNVWTADGSIGIDFSSGALPLSMSERLMKGIEDLQNNPGCSGANEDSWYCDLSIDDLIDYVRGDGSNALSASGTLRDRESFVGTVVNSDTVLNLRQDFVNEGWGRVDPDYFDFIDKKIERLGDPEELSEPSKAAVLVGSNAGMLHAFSVETGRELFSFIPSSLVDRLYQQANPDFSPQPLVDGRFAIADVEFGGSWRTVLVGGLGGGGKGLYALDVTEPESFSSSDFLWELVPDPADPNTSNIGHVFSAPVITRLESGKFVAIFGNGVNGADQEPELFVVDIETGVVLDSARPTVSGDSRDGPNGLMSLGIAMAPATRSHVDRIYAGDLAGRLWRFRMDSSGIDDSATMLFFEAPEDQPITAPPTVAVSVQGGWDVFFGSGQFFAEGDNVIEPSPDEPVQTFYLVRDTNNTTTRDRTELGRAQVTNTIPAAGSRPERREVGSDDFNRNGWYLDLIDENGLARGERIVRRANVGFGAVIVNSYEPVDDVCQGGGKVRLYVLDTITGQGLLQTRDEDGCGDDCGAVELAGSSAPISPPILIQPVEMESEPGDPMDPVDPIESPVLPDPEGLDRATWCARFGVRTPEGFQVLGTVCDGRQSWRQIF